MKGDVKRNTSPPTGHPEVKHTSWQPAQFPLRRYVVTGIAGLLECFIATQNCLQKLKSDRAI
jgi:hypothetical protein